MKKDIGGALAARMHEPIARTKKTSHLNTAHGRLAAPRKNENDRADPRIKSRPKRSEVEMSRKTHLRNSLTAVGAL
jgi:hypothetical protein